MSLKNTYLYSWSQFSEGSRDLAKALDIRRLRRVTESKFVGGPGKTVINWGASEIPSRFLNGSRIINNPEFVRTMSNKLDAFRQLNGSCRIPAFSNEIGSAHKWLANGNLVFARTILNGSGGNGIVVMDPEHPDTHNVAAQLYVLYVKKQDEYRVHVVNNRVIDFAKKGLSREFREHNDVNTKIRNLANGYVFVRENVNPPEDVFTQALSAIRASRLDFGAVDVIWNNKAQSAYVLEINTAPGLQGQTVGNYATAFNGMLG